MGILFVSLLLAFGNHKFNNPEVTTLNISLDREPNAVKETAKELKIVMASDIHLSSYINRKNLERYVALINNQNPDLVLLAGDIAD